MTGNEIVACGLAISDNANSSGIIMQKLFYDKEIIEQFLQSLMKIESLDGGWTTKYIEVSSGLYWMSHVIEELGLTEYLLARLPFPETNELIEIALSSTFPDEIAASATLLRVQEEREGKEFRELLIDRLNQIDIDETDLAEKNRIEIIIKKAELTDRTNRREVLGKHIIEIKKDAEFFNYVAASSNRLLNKLYSSSNCA